MSHTNCSRHFEEGAEKVVNNSWMKCDFHRVKTFNFWQHWWYYHSKLTDENTATNKSLNNSRGSWVMLHKVLKRKKELPSVAFWKCMHCTTLIFKTYFKIIDNIILQIEIDFVGSPVTRQGQSHLNSHKRSYYLKIVSENASQTPLFFARQTLRR